MLDEPSLGLVPVILDDVFGAIKAFKADGTTILLVEPYVHRALKLADRVAILEKGVIVLDTEASAVRAEEVGARYLAV